MTRRDLHLIDDKRSVPIKNAEESSQWPGTSKETELDIELLTEADVAVALRKSRVTLRRWRVLGEGPRYIRVGRNIRYMKGDLEQWLGSRPSGGDRGGAYRAYC